MIFEDGERQRATELLHLAAECLLDSIDDAVSVEEFDAKYDRLLGWLPGEMRTEVRQITYAAIAGMIYGGQIVDAAIKAQRKSKNAPLN